MLKGCQKCKWESLGFTSNFHIINCTKTVLPTGSWIKSCFYLVGSQLTSSDLIKWVWLNPHYFFQVLCQCPLGWRLLWINFWSSIDWDSIDQHQQTLWGTQSPWIGPFPPPLYFCMAIRDPVLENCVPDVFLNKLRVLWRIVSQIFTQYLNQYWPNIEGELTLWY